MCEYPGLQSGRAEKKYRSGLARSFLYHGTIKSNIAMYQDISDEQVQAAAAFVDADSFIQELPQGYDAPVSERGSSFSTGQRQLLPLLEQSPVSLKS